MAFRCKGISPVNDEQFFDFGQNMWIIVGSHPPSWFLQLIDVTVFGFQNRTGTKKYSELLVPPLFLNYSILLSLNCFFYLED
jgi:hypothetical protein